MAAFKRYFLFGVALFAVLGALLVAPVSTTSKGPEGTSTTVLGQPPDSAAAAGSLYMRSTAGSMYVIYYRNGGWYRLYPGDRVINVTSFKPMPGWGARWYRAGEVGSYTAKCYLSGFCGSVPVYGDMTITGVFRL